MLVKEYPKRQRDLCNRHLRGAYPGKAYPLYPACPVCSEIIKRGERAVALLKDGVQLGDAWITRSGTAEEAKKIVGG